MKKIFSKLGIFMFIFFTAYLPIIFLKVKGLNFWSDYSGYIEILNEPLRYFWSINENFFGQFRFIYSNTIFYVFQWLVFKIFSSQYGTFIIIFTINFFNLLFGYILSRIYLKNRLQSLAFSLLFIYNPVYLYALYVNMTLSFLFSIFAFTAFLISFNLYVKRGDKIYLVLASLTSLAIMHPFFFVFFILQSLFLFLYEKKYRGSALFLILTVGLNSFWIFPFIKGFLTSSNIPNILGPSGLNKSILESYVNYSDNLHFMIRSGEFVKDAYKIFYPLIIFIWVFLIFLIKQTKFKKLFLLLPLVFYLFFSFGGTGHFGFIFNYVWNNFRFINFFRSFTNVLYIAWYYLLFIILTLLKEPLSRTYRKFIYPISFIFIIPMLFIGTMSKYGKTVSIPNEYYALNKFINNQTDDFYIFRLPYSLYEYYQWDDSGRDRYFFEDFFNKGVVYNAIGMQTFDSEGLIGNLYRVYYSGRNIDVFSSYGIKYVLISKDLSHVNERYFLPTDKKNFKNYKKIISNRYFDLIEIPNYKGKIVSNNIKVIKKNPTNYELEFSNMKNSQSVIFYSVYDKDWFLYTNQNKPVFAESHTIYNNFGNQWMVDPEYIARSTKEFTKNKDGSLNFRLNLKYGRQDFVNRSFIVSGIFLSICLIMYLAFLLRNYRNNENKQ